MNSHSSSIPNGPSFMYLPKAPSEHLLCESFKILSRLQLIFEFKIWLEYSKDHVQRCVDSPYFLLWDCLLLGAPFNTLLELVGSPTPRHLGVTVDEFDFNLSVKQREEFFANFIQRIQFLEAQGRLTYGEVLRVEDFTGGLSAGYLRILQTINRVLINLQASYPGIYTLPHGSSARRASLIQQFINTERAHNLKLTQTADSAAKLYEDPAAAHPSLEAFIIHCSRLIPYHEHVLKYLAQAMNAPGSEDWQAIFALNNKAFFTRMSSSYRAICANYLTFENFLSNKNPTKEHSRVILRNLSDIISRFSEYGDHLQAILDVTSPSDTNSFDGLCIMVLESNKISESLTEVGRELRTMSCFTRLASRFQFSSSADFLDKDRLGDLLHDDCMLVDPASGHHYSVFLFENMLLCCTDHRRSDSVSFGDVRYPIRPWEIGPALAQRYPLVVTLSIPTSSLKTLHCIDAAIFEIIWGNKSECSVTFYPIIHRQYTQWTNLLEPFVSRIRHSTSVPTYLEESDGTSVYSGVSLLPTDYTFLLLEHGKKWKSVIARPWSLIGRKGNRSESSSMIGNDSASVNNDKASVLSPNLLPTLFLGTGGPGPGATMARSPLRKGFFPDEGDIPSIHHYLTESPVEHAPQQPSLVEGLQILGNGNGNGNVDVLGSEWESLPDLTEDLVKEGRYPIAHGGYSDVWRATWNSKEKGSLKVAVKVLRNTTSDPDMKKKLVKRLHDELSIWKQLSHPHVLELCGTTNGFGPQVSMVCPWLQNGSVTKYMERCGDILTVEDRLKLISEVASGLAYLHTCSVVHGDLTGSNVLVDDNLHARLCDFGLSTLLMEECQDDSSSISAQSAYTSQLGGSVRWADAHLFRALDDESNPPKIGTFSDIYSFGSVMLEILTGRMPYHYLRTDAQVVIQLHQGIKPRRPSSSFADDDQWDLIQRCWMEPPSERPDADEVFEISKRLLESRLR